MVAYYLVIAAYLAILSLLTVYCIHRYYILCAYFKYKKHPFTAADKPAQLPLVTIQLPVYNEMYVIRSAPCGWRCLELSERAAGNSGAG